MNNTFIQSLQNLLIKIELSNLDAHNKANCKALIYCVNDVCISCDKPVCEGCQWYKIFLKVNAKV